MEHEEGEGVLKNRERRLGVCTKRLIGKLLRFGSRGMSDITKRMFRKSDVISF